jgi:hypothetical protein
MVPRRTIGCRICRLDGVVVQCEAQMQHNIRSSRGGSDKGCYGFKWRLAEIRQRERHRCRPKTKRSWAPGAAQTPQHDRDSAPPESPEHRRTDGTAARPFAMRSWPTPRRLDTLQQEKGGKVTDGARGSRQEWMPVDAVLQGRPKSQIFASAAPVVWPVSSGCPREAASRLCNSSKPVAERTLLAVTNKAGNKA